MLERHKALDKRVKINLRAAAELTSEGSSGVITAIHPRLRRR